MWHAIRHLFVALYHFRLLKTLYLNFGVLPLRQAIRLPIIVSCDLELFGIKRGKVIIDTPNVRLGMIRFRPTSSFLGHSQGGVISCVSGGCVVFEGSVVIGCGCILSTNYGGEIKLGDGVIIGQGTKILSRSKITIGAKTQFAWECQVFDTDFHSYSIGGNIRNQNVSVSIGANCWIGNRVSCMKGAVLADGCIVASNSLFNLKQTEENCLYGGSPARLLKTDVKFIG